MSSPLPGPVMVARHAMATRFEVALHGDNAASLRAAAEEALDEIDRLESLLSLYRPDTDIARVNAYAHAKPVRVASEVFRLLVRAAEISAETEGAFDVTVAPLVRCWGFMGGTGAMPTAEQVEEARESVGMSRVELDAANETVRFQRPGMMIDLGAIGKGYAIDRAAEILREVGVSSGLIHGGTSSVAAIGTQPDGQPWRAAITSPADHEAGKPFAIVELRDESLSVSAVWGRSFREGAKSFGHVIDPRTGYPAENALLAAIVDPCATDGDALTTALLTDPPLATSVTTKRPQLRAMVLSGDPAAPTVSSYGITPLT